MAEQRAVRSTLQRFEWSRLPILDYILDVTGINLTKEFLTTKKETFKTSQKNLITADSRVEYGVMTTQYLDCMDLAIKFIYNRGVKPGEMLINTMYQDDVLHFKRVMGHMVATKANTYVVDLKHLPKNMQPNNK